MKKRIPAVILMFALFLSTSFAANALSKTINVSYGINVEFNDQPITMTDAAGKPVDAFLYQGTTYVPIRAISETFGAYVGYDSSTNTAYVYDDFTEIITAGYKLYTTIALCESTLDLYATSVNYTFSHDPYEIISSNQRYFDRDEAMLDLLSEENVNYDLLTEKLIPIYEQYLDYYELATTAFLGMYTAKDYVNATDFLRYRALSGSAEVSYLNAFESFLDSYNWRTF